VKVNERSKDEAVYGSRRDRRSESHENKPARRVAVIDGLLFGEIQRVFARVASLGQEITEEGAHGELCTAQ
jgi:hypothetical protein